jgi:RNA polymerase sigma factor for flagellar operon FliA
MHPRELFDANLLVIERVVAHVCRNARLQGADAEDFASAARLRLLEHDCGVLARYEGRSSLAGYLTIVVRRFLIDYKRTQGQRWFASAEAQRRGAAAVLLEQLLRRDGRTLDEAIAVAGMRFPDVTAAALEALAAQLPDRPPTPRLVAMEEEEVQPLPSRAAADEIVGALDIRDRSRDASRAVRAALAGLTPEDRVIIRLRYGKEMSIADIARALGVAQRPLYRRVEALMAGLRRTLEDQGLRAGDVADLAAGAGESLDFGLANGKTDAAHPSIPSRRGLSTSQGAERDGTDPPRS